MERLLDTMAVVLGVLAFVLFLWLFPEVLTTTMEGVRIVMEGFANGFRST